MKCPYKGKFKVTQEFKGSKHDGLDIVGLDSKNVHSTINGVVEKAGWENSSDKKQGFGLYVRIKEDNSVDKYYFGHLSKISVTKGQRVSVGDIIGIEGNTGYSFGSHCHYCARGNGSKSQIRDIVAISGIPNVKGTYENKETNIVLKSNTEIANEVIKGVWGNGAERKQRLTAAGYNYTEIQNEVNRLVSNKPVQNKKSDTEIAKEVIKGLWGNGAERKSKLTAAGYNYSKVQSIVNSMLKG